MKKSFFCEACGAEVRGRADSCPSCGRSFLGIRCPRCGKEGSAEVFVKGCPDCGYMTEMKSADTARGHQKLEWPSANKHRSRPLWPTSRYLALSFVLLFSIALILYFWLR